MNCNYMEIASFGLKVSTFLATAMGVVLGLVQWRKNGALKRAELIDGIFEKFRTDENVRKAVYLFDYNQDWYTEEFHGKSRRSKGAEDSVDIGLTYFSYVCYLYQTNILRDEDFELFKYTIDRAIVNRGVQDYFYNLYHFSTRQGIPFPFPALLKYAEQNGLLTNGFFSIKSSDSEDGCFHRFLNF